MLKKILIPGFAALLLLGLGIYPLQGKSNKPRLIRVNKCIYAWTAKVKSEEDTEFYIFAKNKCNNPETIGKRIKITAARNVTAEKGYIIDTKRYVVPEKSQKLLFMVSKRVPGKKRALLRWKFIR